MFGYGLLPLAIALHAPLLPLLVAATVNGLAWAFWSIMWQTSVQTHVSPELLSRVTLCSAQPDELPPGEPRRVL
jgi:hypothetical protein